jgi:hypothetical protein
MDLTYRLVRHLERVDRVRGFLWKPRQIAVSLSSRKEVIVVVADFVATAEWLVTFPSVIETPSPKLVQPARPSEHQTYDPSLPV